jgi:OmpA-OmpF porin, OOP family
MAESLFASLLHSLDQSSISQIASSLREPEQNISKGMESSIASVLGAMVSKAGDPGGLGKMLDLVPSNFGEMSWSKMAAGLSSAGSSLIDTGKQLLPGLFGSSSSSVANAVARDSGIGPAKATTLLAMAAPMVLGFLSRRVRDQGWSMRELSSALLREGATIRTGLPAGVDDLFWPRASAATASSPVIAQAVQHETSSRAGWLGVLTLGAAALGGFWLWTHIRRPVETAAVQTTGEANRLTEEAGRWAGSIKRRLPNGIDVPRNGIESRLLNIIDGTDVTGRTSWLDFDHLMFDSGSSKLRPDSAEQLDHIAAILRAYPNVQLNIAGFTDNVGSSAENLELSRARAESVKKALVSRGISPDRLAVQGFGETLSDNSTTAARASNRRVAVQVAQR